MRRLRSQHHRRRLAHRARSGAVAAVVAALVVTGCSGIPTRSPVEPGLEVGAPDVEIPRVQLRPPAPGATPTEIIAGFMDAASSPEDDFAAARAYLTDEAERSWNPDQRVTIYPDDVALRPQVANGSATLRVPVVARLDGTGRYLPADPGETATTTLGLRQVDGEWRIASLPAGFGLWLSAEWFNYLFRRLTVSYVDPFDRSLVRDPRWVASGRSGPTELAESQLDPVPDYLRGAAVSGFPLNTGLGVKSVPVVDGVAQVELTDQATKATADQRKGAWAQILRTMRQWPGVRAVSITVDGDPLPLVDDAGQPMNLSDPPTSIEALGYEENSVTLTSIVLRSGTHLTAQDLAGWFRGGENQRSVDSSLPEVPLTWTHVAMGSDLTGRRRHVVAVDTGHSRLMRWTAQGSGPVPVFASGLTEPAVDKRDRAWIGGTDPSGAPRIWYIPVGAAPNAVPTQIEDDWLSGRIVAVKPSPGGRRLAIALTDEGVTSLYVAGVSLGQGRDPVALSRPWRVATGLGELRDLAWVGDTSLGILSARGDTIAPALVPLGDEMQPLDAVPDADHLVSAGNDGGPLVVSSKGVVWRRAGAQGWQRQTTAQQIVVPGT